MNRALILALLFSTVGTSGCYAVRYSSGDLDRVDRQQAVVHKTWSHNLVWGLASANKVDIDELCGPAGAAELKSHFGPFGLFGQIVSLGFWTPIRVKVTCHPDHGMVAQVHPQATPQPPEPPPLAVPAATARPEDRVVVVPADGGRTVIIVE